VADATLVDVDADTQDVESTCLLMLTWPDVELTDPAAGRLVVAVSGLDDATVAYDITRTSAFDVFATIGAVALLMGIVGGLLLRVGVGDQNVPATWTFKEGWASSLTAITAGTAALFGLTGVLDEYAPQYSLAGALAANLIVAVLVLLAPVVFSAFGGKSMQQRRKRRGFVASGVVSLMAAAAQLCLVALVIVSGSTDGRARATTLVLTLLVLVVALVYALHEARTVKDAVTASI
jgi:hypothetical protein